MTVTPAMELLYAAHREKVAKDRAEADERQRRKEHSDREWGINARCAIINELATLIPKWQDVSPLVSIREHHRDAGDTRQYAYIVQVDGWPRPFRAKVVRDGTRPSCAPVFWTEDGNRALSTWLDFHSYLVAQDADPADVVEIRIYPSDRDGHHWEIDGVDQYGRYTGDWWCCESDSKRAALSLAEEFRKDHGISFSVPVVVKDDNDT